MLLTLANFAENLEPMEDARMLGEVGQETFEEEEQLEGKPEHEIARRAFAVYETESEDENDEDEDDGSDC